MTSFPRDLIVNILSRLSVKDLLRLRSTSKLWCSLIDQSFFVNLHLRHSLRSAAHQTIILRHSDLTATSVASLGSLINLLDCPLMNNNAELNVVGSCNGLLCISSINDMAVWNPWIKKYLLLPHFALIKEYLYAYGFGYDSVSDDYKVIRIINGMFNRNSNVLEFYVASLRKTGWRRIYPDIEFGLSKDYLNGVFACGSLHWVVSSKEQPNGKNMVLAFDLGDETFRELSQPQDLEPPPPITNTSIVVPSVWDIETFKLVISVLEDCFCLVPLYDRERADVWVMKKYGVKESWTRLFSVSSSWPSLPFLSSVKPLVYASGGNMVLLEISNFSLFWYDLREKKIGKKVQIPYRPGLGPFNTWICVESLVSPHLKDDRNTGMVL